MADLFLQSVIRIIFVCLSKKFTVYIEKNPNKPTKLDFCAVAGSKRTVADIIHPDEDDDADQKGESQSKKPKEQPERNFQHKCKEEF